MICSSDDIVQLQAEIYKVLNDLEKLRDGYAVARQVIEYDGERKKGLLSRTMVACGGKSMAEREMTARASSEHEAGLIELGKQLAEAHKVVARYYALGSKLDALRSILSCQKVLAKEI